MQITDTIADLLTRIRNAQSAKHETVDIPASNMKKAICQILVDEGYVKGFTVKEDGKQGVITVTLKYAEAGSPHLLQRGRAAEGHEGPWHRDHLHLEGRYDRPRGEKDEYRRRSSRVHLVIREVQ